MKRFVLMFFVFSPLLTFAQFSDYYNYYLYIPRGETAESCNSNIYYAHFDDDERLYCSTVSKSTLQNESREWKIYGKVNALCFPEFDWLACIGDGLKYENISEKFYELEDEGGYLLKPINVSILIYYRYFDGEKQYRMHHDIPNKSSRWVNFSLNPHTTIEYVIDNNNRPNMREKDVSNYTHFLEVDGELYFIKMK